MNKDNKSSTLKGKFSFSGSISEFKNYIKNKDGEYLEVKNERTNRSVDRQTD
jgi:hypothetical protein